MRHPFSRAVLLALLLTAPLSAQTLRTRWAKDVTADNVHREYPRPQMTRKDWTNLNGHWDYAIRPKDEKEPGKWDGKILVPFPVESQLSGVGKRVGEPNRLWYHRAFRASAGKGQRVHLHFGAVDWHATVWVNGTEVGQHRGGFDPFRFDITAALKEEGPQRLVVAVWDPSDRGTQPRGKQIERPHGIWYTPVTGIWQTVWLETVPDHHVQVVRATPDIDRGVVDLAITTSPAERPFKVEAKVRLRGAEVASAVLNETERNQQVRTSIAFPKDKLALWSPDAPTLYDLDVRLTSAASEDAVTCSFGMRKIEVKKAKDGFNRLFLNNEPLFQYGPLDQGWWPDGLYTPPSDDALTYDLEVTKKLGFNMVRKHVKVESARWYHHCDRMGLLVWQDMPSGDRYIGPRDPDIKRSPESARQFETEWRAIMDALHNHPCVVVWVPFNEGWGQFDTDKVLAWTKQRDPSRLVDGPSGWTDRGTGDLHDVHIYPGPGMPPPEEKRAVVLGEFGGLGLPLEGHLWQQKDNWGYRTYKTRDELALHYRKLVDQLPGLIHRGLAAAVYTQTTDVEGEVNGLLTYDRAVLKLDAEKTAELHRRLYLPAEVIGGVALVPTSEKQAQTWRWTKGNAPAGWEQPGFDDSKWAGAPGGFGTRETPGAVVRTVWNTPDVWLRRTFELKDVNYSELRLRVHHDEDALVYLNGKLLLPRLTGYSTGYFEVVLDTEARKLFKRGTNVLAVHCRQTGGGQYIDVGLYGVPSR